MLRVSVEQLEREQREDNVPAFWPMDGEELRPPPIEARATEKETDMANESAEKVIAEGWEEVSKAAASGGTWLKFENGQSHTLNVFSKPVFFEKIWEGEAKRRVRVDVFIPSEGIRRWEMSPSTLRELAEERADAKQPFEDALFQVTRKGVGKETRFKMRYSRQLTPQEVAERSDAGALNGVDAGEPF